jgi:hypothetical protein
MGTKQGPAGAVFTNGEAGAIENGEVLPQNAERLVSCIVQRERKTSRFTSQSGLCRGVCTAAVRGAD